VSDAALETLRGGRYVLVGSLGEGAQGRTFDAVDKREGRAVAIKRFDVRGARSWKDVELAEREARVLQSLSHPRLPRYVEHFEEGGALYLVMEKMDGESLAALRKRGATLGEQDVWRLLGDASQVLDYLHGRASPVIHRDLKPGNVIRRPDGSFAFVDFGAVRDKLRPEGGSTVVGTFGYMGPEQFQGRALPSSDVYAIGATALTMLTGCEPEQLPHKGLAVDVRAALRGRASDRLAATLERMLDPDPDRRAARIAPLLEGRGERDRREARQARPARQGREARDDEATRRFEREARDYERRAREYERRAERGGPGAEGWHHGADGWRQGAQRWREASERYRDAMERSGDRRERRKARRQARRLERAMRRRERAQRGLPFPFSLLFALVFTLGIFAVSFATQLVVPFVLAILSLVLGKRLAEAAVLVRDAGRSAIAEMRRSRAWFRGETSGGADGAAAPGPHADAGGPNVRVDESTASHDAPRARVAPDRPPYPEAEDEAAEDAEEVAEERRRRL
jgi:hypothetical protein